ncbi:trehalose-binding protein [Oceanidesulfovibrio indonesiensis]|uniref:Trehalose-binding protein n=1 Tax=Oceanidesulfovibrio indonesiensis TaxID=54767 RepID=A0A7M3MFI7_9BACT|nr:FmdE family protein [Oceanidesulfovibrio indonesiensis]TVM17392.1 trehalose-binding protein [Oceanidesulfovibrio indonesiensis]
MNIGPYTFQEFKDMAKAFHGYPAPGLLVGGYMVELAKSRLPEGTLFEALVESPKCLPDAVQLLTLCSMGNGWVKVLNLGRYALTLFDKYTGEGWRVWIDPARLEAWPEIAGWYLKRKPKAEQDTGKLFAEIEEAGDAILGVAPVQVDARFLGKGSMGAIGLCPACGEAYPASDGPLCRGCQGEEPVRPRLTEDVDLSRKIDDSEDFGPVGPEAVPVAEAVGRMALHDMTRVVPGVSKGVAVSAGQTITAGDVCRLQQMGRNTVYVTGDPELNAALAAAGQVHENDAALAMARALAGENVACDEIPHEGKITLRAVMDGVLVYDRDRLESFNCVPDVMCAVRQSGQLIESGKPFGGLRALPLFLRRDLLDRALAVVGDEPIFAVKPLRPRRAGILVTGTEVFQGLIEDRFAPILTGKLEALGSTVAGVRIAPDDRQAIAEAARELVEEEGANLILTTAGLSVDPDDVTRKGMEDAGLTDTLFGSPMLPGAMLMLGRLDSVPVVGVPACALFYKTTSLDVVLPRVLADVPITRRDLARHAAGGFCLTCKSCTFPKCPFGK